MQFIFLKSAELPTPKSSQFPDTEEETAESEGTVVPAEWKLNPDPGHNTKPG